MAGFHDGWRGPEYRDALIEHAEKYPWTHAVTLAFNAGDVSLSVAEDRLCEFVRRLNREAAGPRWQKRPDEQIFSFWCLEKPEVNTHWHGAVWLEAKHVSKLSIRGPLARTFEKHWQYLVASGTLDIQNMDDKPGWLAYAGKELRKPVQYSAFRYFTGLE
jgi:hypothetical protein